MIPNALGPILCGLAILSGVGLIVASVCYLLRNWDGES